jgi:invasion protein IalB
MVQPPPGGAVGVLGGAFWGFSAVGLISIILAIAGSPPAGAETKTEKSFGGWTVTCTEPDNGPKSCSMVQSLATVDKQTNSKRIVMKWAISNNKSHEQTQSVAVPTGVSIKEGVRLFLGEAEPIVIAYSFCGPKQCFGSSPLDAKFIAAIKASKKASASYVLGSKQLVQVPLDLSGFAEAYEYLVQQLA